MSGGAQLPLAKRAADRCGPAALPQVLLALGVLFAGPVYSDSVLPPSGFDPNYVPTKFELPPGGPITLQPARPAIPASPCTDVQPPGKLSW